MVYYENQQIIRLEAIYVSERRCRRKFNFGACSKEKKCPRSLLTVYCHSLRLIVKEGQLPLVA
jgi:hypothetical protein